MKHSKLYFILTMIIFGSIGLFVKQIMLSSSQIALARGVIASSFLLIISLLLKKKISLKAIRKNILLLVLSGTCIGFNWILLFEAYKYTSISNATLSYYFAPVFVILVSPMLLKERLSLQKILCMLGAIAGMFLLIGINQNLESTELIGILYGLSAAVLYALVVIMNKFLNGLTGIERTLVQLGTASVVLFPYVISTGKINYLELDINSTILLIIVGVIHTGIAYLIYFTTLSSISGQTASSLSYLDPISAIIMSSILLNEKMTLIQIFGAILILGSTFLSERKITNKSNIESF